MGTVALRLFVLWCCLSPTESFGRLFKSIFNRTVAQEGSTVGCGDHNVQCQQWASGGECEANPTFMLSECARSCGKCAGYRKVPKAKRGCQDDTDYDCAKKAAEGGCDSDKGEMIYRCPQSCHVCHMYTLIREALGCEDLHNNCQEWARTGECKANPHYMFENCPVACGSCKEKRESCNRPPDTPPTVHKGDINETMVRILRDFPQYNPQKISWPGGPKGSKAPWVITLENFISDEEAEVFKETCANHFDRSLAGDQLSPVRTSHQCWCSGNACEAHEVTQTVAQRIANLTRSQVRYFEPFQVLKYEVGQFYKVHHDQNSGLFTPQGPRVYTFFMYLSTPEAGGGTRFANLEHVVPAVKGNAVLWPSIMNDDPTRDEPMTHHEALPVMEGRKYASNVWIHQYDYRTPANRNCMLTHKNTH